MSSGMFGWAESGRRWRSEIEKRTGFESRSVVLGHIQRGGSPSAFDRVLATRYGLGAIDMVHRGEFGQMAALRGNKIISIPLAEAIASNRKVDKEILDAAIGILDKLDYKVRKFPELATRFTADADLPRSTRRWLTSRAARVKAATRPGFAWHGRGFRGILTQRLRPRSATRFRGRFRAYVSRRNPAREPSGAVDTASLATRVAGRGSAAEADAHRAGDTAGGAGGGGSERLGFLVSAGRRSRRKPRFDSRSKSVARGDCERAGDSRAGTQARPSRRHRPLRPKFPSRQPPSAQRCLLCRWKS